MSTTDWTEKINWNHHAFLIEGEHAATLDTLLKFFEKNKIATKGNPDFWLGEFEVLSIDEAKVLKRRNDKKTFSGGKKFFVLSFGFITREAENSLLKLFEEPFPETHTFVIVPNREILLPTLLSRFEIIKTTSEQDKDSEKAAIDFLAAKPSERLKIVRKLAEEISDGKKSKEEAVKLLNGLEKTIYEKTNLKTESQSAKVFAEIEKCKDFLNDRSPSIKMILEHLSLIMPKF